MFRPLPATLMCLESRVRQAVSLACLLFTVTACLHLQMPGSGGGIEHAQSAAQFAEEILRLQMETQALRPLAQAVAGRSFGESSVDALEVHLALVAALLLENEGRVDGNTRTAIQFGLGAAGLYYDLIP